MKKLPLFFGLLTFILSTSCNEIDETFEEKENSSNLLKKEINNLIIDEIAKTNTFDWNNLNTENLWSAIELSDNKVSIAYKFENGNDEDKYKILDFILKSENKNKEEIVLLENSNLDILLVQIKNKNTILGLRNMKEVELIEPAYQMYSNEESIEAISKIKTDPINYVNLKDFGSLKNKNVPTNISYPSYYDNHNIKNAWLNNIKGSSIKCAVIDGGVKIDDVFLGQNGNITGQNTEPRTVEKYGFFKFNSFNPFSPYDGAYETGFQLPSNHGTDMCTGIAGPLGNTTGVAYNSSLISIRSSWSVWIDPLDNSIAVSKAFEDLSEKNDVKVISMSMGSLLPYIWVTRAIEKCTDKGKLVFCAGGTFYLPVIQHLLTLNTGLTLFPARLPNVISCTGIKKLESTFNVPYWGKNCFGVADFVLEFDETFTTNTDQASSSRSTCTTAGMAALIWSRQPNLKDFQVLNKMKAAGDYPFGNHPFFGYGRVDMRKYLNNEGIPN